MVQIGSNGAFIGPYVGCWGLRAGGGMGSPRLAEDALSWVLIRPQCDEHPNFQTLN